MRTCAQLHAPPLCVNAGRFSFSTHGMRTSRAKLRRSQVEKACTPSPQFRRLLCGPPAVAHRLAKLYVSSAACAAGLSAARSGPVARSRTHLQLILTSGIHVAAASIFPAAVVGAARHYALVLRKQRCETAKSQ